MPPGDPNVVGGIINNLPLAKMFSAPLMAVIDCQSESVRRTVDFIEQVGLNEDGTVRMVPFAYKEQLTDDAGNPTEQVDRVISVPLIAVTDIPRFTMEKAIIDFELEVNTMEEDKSASEKEGSFSAAAKAGWGPFSVEVKVQGRVSSHKESTRRTDTRAKYTIHVEAGQAPPPEALNRVIETLLAATTKPLSLPPGGAAAPAPAVAPAA